MVNLVEVVGDRIAGKVPWGKRRSPKWGSVREAYLKEHPLCEVCGGKKGVEVHHIESFHEHPEKELLKSNLISLCSKFSHHLFWGHLGSYKSINKLVVTDALKWNNKIVCRS